LKQAIALRDSRERRATARLLVDGARETARALAAGIEPIEAYVAAGADQGGPAAPRVREAIDALHHRGVPLTRVARDAFAKLAYGDRDDGVVLVASAPRRALAELSLPPEPLVAVLDGLEKPGNLGAILRTADGAGIDAVVVVGERVDLFNPNAIRASVGAVFKANVAVASLDDTRAWLASLGATTYATLPEAAIDYTTADFRGAAAIVLGSEADGLPDAWRAGDVRPIALPMRGVADSLNVSAAAAVLFYEALRQRTA
jgi:TrmH family RNA methyltransferase